MCKTLIQELHCTVVKDRNQQEASSYLHEGFLFCFLSFKYFKCILFKEKMAKSATNPLLYVLVQALSQAILFYKKKKKVFLLNALNLFGPIDLV